MTSVIDVAQISAPDISIPTDHGGDYDVVVAGGGLAGVAAAVSAARRGASVLLVEAHPFVGGNGVLGLPLSSFRAANSSKIIVGGFARELLERLRESGAVEADPGEVDWIENNSEQLQLELTDLLTEAGVDLVTNAPVLAATVADRRITEVIVHNKDGRALRYRGKAFVDTTGDAQLTQLAGGRTQMGRNRDGQTQSMSLVFTVGGIDESRAPSSQELADQWDGMLDAGALFENTRRSPSSGRLVGKPGMRTFIATRIMVPKGTDNRLLAAAELQGRRLVAEFMDEFLRPHVPGYENSFIASIAPHIGVRETRRVVGRYEMQDDDVLEGRRFPDSIACNSMPLENHSPDSGDVVWEFLPEGSYYTIPYGSIVSADLDNLFAAGRCVSASHEALAALRVLTIAMATGQAAGTAASLSSSSSDSGIPDADAVRAALVAEGAIVD